MSISKGKLDELWELSKHDDFFDLVAPSTLRMLIKELIFLKGSAKTDQPVQELRKRGYSEIAEEHVYAKSNLEDKLLEFGMTDWDELWTDPYDNSIELGSVDPDNRLSSESQKYLSDEGFTTCWLNHKDNMETAYYKLDGSEGSRRPASPHRCKPILPMREASQPDGSCREEFAKWHKQEQGCNAPLTTAMAEERWDAWQGAWNARPVRESGSAPISTAPRDGTEILAWSIEGGNWHQVYWKKWENWQWMDKFPSRWAMRWNPEYYQNDANYSHWMHMPKTPITHIEGQS